MAIFDEPSREPLPQPTIEDVQHAARKGLISMVPLIGGAGAELIGLLGSPVTTRRDTWLADLERRLREMESKIAGFHFEELRQNEQFVSSTLQATQIAIRTHQEAKREALRNAVLNVAAGNAPDEDRQLMFLDLIDTFTTWHLRILSCLCGIQTFGVGRDQNFFDRPRFLGSPASRLEYVFPELHDQRDFFEQVIKDLFTRGLITSDAIYTDPGGPFAKRTTQMGDAFLAFIDSPI